MAIEHVEICKSAREYAIGDVDIVQVDGHDVVTGGKTTEGSSISDPTAPGTFSRS